MNQPKSVSTAVLLAVAVAICSVGLAVVPAVGQHPTARVSFRSCDDLTSVYPNGVAKNQKAASRAVRDGFYRPSTSKRARKVYRENRNSLDRDRDGVACEQTA